MTQYEIDLLHKTADRVGAIETRELEAAVERAAWLVEQARIFSDIIGQQTEEIAELQKHRVSDYQQIGFLQDALAAHGWHYMGQNTPRAEGDPRGTGAVREEPIAVPEIDKPEGPTQAEDRELHEIGGET